MVLMTLVGLVVSLLTLCFVALIGTSGGRTSGRAGVDARVRHRFVSFRKRESIRDSGRFGQAGLRAGPDHIASEPRPSRLTGRLYLRLA